MFLTVLLLGVLQMENTDESHASVNELLPGMNQIVCDNSPSVGMGPDYDLQQSNLALLKAELKVINSTN